MWSAVVLTHKPLGGVDGGCASHLSFHATKPRGNPSLSIFLPRESWAVSPWRVWFFSSSQHGPELSQKSELIITSGVAFSGFRLGLKTSTTWALQQSNWNSNKKTHLLCLWLQSCIPMKTSQCRNYTVFGISRERSEGLYILFQPLRGYWLHTRSLKIDLLKPGWES